MARPTKTTNEDLEALMAKLNEAREMWDAMTDLKSDELFWEGRGALERAVEEVELRALDTSK